MTTAQLRTAALEAADRLEWAKAADLMQAAIDAYPARGAMADLDKARMSARVRGWRSTAKSEAA